MKERAILAAVLLVAAAVAVGGAVASLVGADPPPADAHIARVAAGLLPAITFAGEPRATMRLEDRLVRHQVPGVGVAVVAGGELEWARGWGVVRHGQVGAVRADTAFQAGSVSKTVAAMLTLRLVAEGRLGLDDPVNERLKSWRLPDTAAGGEAPVTVRHLLSHSAGLAPATYRGVDPSGGIPTVLELLSGKGQADLAPVSRSEPPGRFAYSNPAFVVLEQLLVDVSGRPFAELARTELFEPLGMTASTFAASPPPTLLERAAWGHEQLQPLPTRGLVFPAAVGGLWSTPSDLARLLAAFMRAYRAEDGRMTTPALAREAMRAQAGSQGLCGAVEGEGDGRRLIQMGAAPGFVALLVAYPELGRGAVVMVNAGGRSGELTRELARAVAVEYGWPGYVTSYERTPLPAGIVATACGTYEFTRPGLPTITVTEKDGRLFWADREMVPVAGGAFVVPEAGIEVEFVGDGAGAVIAAEFRPPAMRPTRVVRVRAPAGS